jgi:predicted porin
MRQRLLPTLIGSALAAGPAIAHAQASVNLFGTAYGQFENVSVSGAVNPAQDKPARWRLSSVSSDFGIRASVPLGEGLTGLAQYATGVNVDTSAKDADGKELPGGMWSTPKDVFVGMGIANVGTIKLGRLTAAARWISGTPDFSPSGAGPQDNQMALSSSGGQTGASARFNARFDNALGFESASFGGLSARAYFGANENKSNATVTTGSPQDDKSMSVGVQFVRGPFDVRASYEVRNDAGTLNNTKTNDTRDKDYRIGLRYTLPTGTALGIAYDRMSFHDASATGTQKVYLKRTGWALGARHAFDKHVVYGGYGHAGNMMCSLANGAACDGTDTGAKQIVLAYNYVFNKQMLAEAYVSQVKNQLRAKYDFDSGGVGAATGSKVSAMGVGLRYTF